MAKSGSDIRILASNSGSFKQSPRTIQGAAVNYSDQSDPTRNPNFRNFWRRRDPFFRRVAEPLPPIPAAAGRTPANSYEAFLDRARAALREVNQ